MRILFLLLFFPFCVQSQIITTYAGNGISGAVLGDGGPATNAEIAVPYGINFDDTGNLLICQQDLIRKVDKLTGIITTIAGSDTASSLGHGGDGGPAIAASILEPYDVCVDRADNYYIADRWYSEVRKVTLATGIIDTFAGDRTGGALGDGGPAVDAELNAPVSVCFDSAQQYLYISNQSGFTVRRVNMLTGTITSFAGTGGNGYSGDGGPAIDAEFSRLLGICFDQNNNLYIGDWDNARIRKVDAITGIVTTVAGTGIVGCNGDGGPAISAAIDRPTSLCFDKCGNLYFTNEDSNRVRRIDAVTGIITTIAGNGISGFAGDSGLAVNAELFHPVGVCIDSAGNLYIADQGNNRVRKVTLPFTVGIPTISITAIMGDTLLSGAMAVYSATATVGGSSPYTYQWYVNGMPVVGSTSSVYTYMPANGDSVSCKLTVINPCAGIILANSNTIHMVVKPEAVAMEGIVSKGISIYPNPAHNEITVRGSNIVNIAIINAIGQIMLTKTVNTNLVSIDISAIQLGMYVVKVTDTKGMKSLLKIFKE